MKGFMQMSQHFLSTLQEIRKLHTFYVITFGVILLSFITSPSANDGSVKVLGLIVIMKRYSLIVGILFGLFVIGLSLYVKHLERISAMHDSSEALKETAEHLRCFPWVLSPFGPSRSGRWGFWVSIVAGFVYIAWLGIVHVLGFGKHGAEFGLIGVFDILITCSVSPMLWRMSRRINGVAKFIH